MTAAHGGGAGDGSVWSSGTGSAWPNRWAFAALKDDGAVVTWGSSPRGGDQGVYSISQFTGVEQIADVSDQLQGGVSEIYTSGAAFAALKDDGAVVTWGDAAAGGDSGDVADDLAAGVVAVYSTDDAFAALKDDGSVVTWGNGARGGNSSAVAEALTGGVVTIHSTQTAFAAIKADGSVATWGQGTWGGNSSAVADDLAGGVVTIHATERAFAALKDDGSVVTWGVANYGGDASAVADALEGGVTALYSTQRAFAALKADGSVVAWGADLTGGDASAVAHDLTGGVVDIVTSQYAFAALKEDGSVVTWGWNSGGGDSGAVAEALSADVVSIASTNQAFAALKDDGSVVVWGGSQAANTGPVAAALQEDVIALYTNTTAFAALKADGSVVTWGSLSTGGDSSAVAGELGGGVVAIYATPNAFAALKEDGSVVTWGDGDRGGDSSAVSDDLAGGVERLAAPFAVEPVNLSDFVSPPDAPVIDAVADDDVIDPDAAAEGIIITGTAAPDADVTVTLADAVQTVTANADGVWQASVAADDIPGDGDYIITAQATIQGISGPVAERPVSVVSPPDAPVIDTVAGDDVIDPDEGAEGITISGTAAPGATVAVSFAEATQTATAGTNGAWAVSFPPEDIPEAGDYTITAQATLNGLTGPGAERSVAVVTAPDAPVIDTVAGDDVIDPDEAAEGITVTGTAAPGATVEVSFAGATQTATADANGAWSASFGPDDIPEDGDYTVTAQATVNGLTGPSAERSVTVEPLPDLIDLDAGIKGPGDGSIWATGTGIAYANERAFAALKEDGSVVTWGAPGFGGDSSAVAADLQSGVVAIHPSRNAFAALKEDGSVVTWGSATLGGDSSFVADQLSGDVVALYSSRSHFVALKEDGSVVFWGAYAGASHPGSFNVMADQLQGDVVDIRTARFSFAALKDDGAVVTWANPLQPVFVAESGGDPGAVADALQEGVSAIYSNSDWGFWGSESSAFAALKADGSVVTWGAASNGGDSSAVSEALSSGVTDIATNRKAFAALKDDGSVVAWGDPAAGGDPGLVADSLAEGVTALKSTATAFAALKDDGSVVTWGYSVAGGDSSAVAEGLSSGVVSLASSSAAFAALKEDGSVIAWGSKWNGAGQEFAAVSDELGDGVVKLYSNLSGFAALKQDGSVVSWGLSLSGSYATSASELADALSGGVVKIYTTRHAFAAVKEDGSVVTWGAPDHGGDSSAVADQLSGGVVALSAPFPVEPLDPASLADPPAAPVIGAVAGDDVIDVTEAAEGITVTGSAEPGATVTVRLSDILAASTTADDTGNWQVVFTPESQLDLGAHTIFATANVGGLSSAVASRDVTVVAPPMALVIDRVAGNNVITPDEAAEGLAITGSAAPGAEVAVTFGDFAQSTTVSPDGTWRVELPPQQIPEPGDHFVLARATLDGTASPLVGRRVSVVEPPSAPEIFPVGVDDVIAPGDLDFGLDMRGLADPGARVIVSFGDITQTVMATAEGMVTGGWEVLFDLEDLPPAGEHLVTAQAARDGLFSDVTERLVTIENTPARIFGDTTGQVIDGDPTAEQDRGTLLVIDRDPGEDRFQAPDPQDLETLFGAFRFDPLTGDWMFTLDNDSPAVQAMTEGEEATVGLTVTSQDGTASETITITITGAGVADPDPTGPYMLAGQIIDRAQEGLPGAVIYFTPDEGEMLAFGTDLDGNFSLELPAGSSGLLAPIRDYDEFDPSITAASALETLRLSVGLDPSWGPADAMDFIAADFLGSGAVTALDALEILRVSVGLEAEMPPRWLFLDADADLSHVDRQNTVVDTGRVVDPLMADTTDLALVGILVGHVQAVPIITES